ncbi:hypothetical protein [Phaeobacter sp. HF9A]|uniref:hypothetical protein n=1 Tax=Phaeobacter sp. HF9A TaxID=2721561 RepID=UPI00142FD5BE|nr:hypothetical protein [Phaeobacter sp. HF9A]NIZ12595.1 hypothetical protein [Phaeobacter sp. HF9A]
MTNYSTTVLASLSEVGLGPQRLQRAANGEPLLGQGGLLNSIELVQFIVTLSENTDVDVYDFMDQVRTEGGRGDIADLSNFLAAQHAPQAMMG